MTFEIQSQRHDSWKKKFDKLNLLNIKNSAMWKILSIEGKG